MFDEAFLNVLEVHLRTVMENMRNQLLEQVDSSMAPGALLLNFFYATAPMAAGYRYLDKSIPFDVFDDEQLIELALNLSSLDGETLKSIYNTHNTDFGYVYLSDIKHVFEREDGYVGKYHISIVCWIALLNRNPSKENIEAFLEYLYNSNITWKNTRMILKACPWLFENMNENQLSRTRLDAKRIVPILYELIYQEKIDLALPAYYNDFIDNGFVAIKLSGNNTIPPTLMRQVKVVRKKICP